MDAKSLEEFKKLLILQDENKSKLQKFMDLPIEDRKRRMALMTDDQKHALLHDWEYIARPKQLIPSLHPKTGKPWRTCLVLAGRGFGKTRTSSEFIRGRWKSGELRYGGIVASNPDEAKKVFIKGPSGIIKTHQPGELIYSPANKEVTWKDGAVCSIFSAEEPDQLRGPNLDTIAIDELAKFPKADQVMDEARAVLRAGSNPRMIITTTPRPIPIIKDLMEDPEVLLIIGSSFENVGNMSESWFEDMYNKYSRTRRGKQELYAEILSDFDNALWKEEFFKESKVDSIEPKDIIQKLGIYKVYIGVDPSGTAKKAMLDPDKGDECGIIVAGIGYNNYKDETVGYILEDASGHHGVEHWPKKVAELYAKWSADKVIAEVNFGGDMVVTLLNNAFPEMNAETCWASKSKEIRAEPVAHLYEEGRVFHVKLPEGSEGNDFSVLEDQYCAMTTTGYKGRYSPDHVDAAVWALDSLMISSQSKFELF